jgi:hypothetical protein
MPTYIPRVKTCSICGTSSTHNQLAACIEFKSPDIDLRPAEPRRSTMAAWVQQCPQCGLCALDLDEPPRGAAAVVETKEYLDVLRGPSPMPVLARQFRAVSLLAERAGMLVAAANNALHAAWACDDANEIEAACECRMRAITFFVQVASDVRHAAAEPATSPAKHPELWNLQLVDLLRRTRRFDEARERCHAALRSADGNVQLVGRLQLELIDKSDTAAHSADEAVAN